MAWSLSIMAIPAVHSNFIKKENFFNKDFHFHQG